jgi:hypothetical protein
MVPSRRQAWLLFAGDQVCRFLVILMWFWRGVNMDYLCFCVMIILVCAIFLQLLIMLAASVSYFELSLNNWWTG